MTGWPLRDEQRARTRPASTTEAGDFEVWDSRSGNMLLSVPDPDEAWAWLRDFRARYGDEALDGLSVGTDDNVDIAAGSELRDILDSLDPDK